MGLMVSIVSQVCKLTVLYAIKCIFIVLWLPLHVSLGSALFPIPCSITLI